MRSIEYRGYIKNVGVMLPVDSIQFGMEVVGFNIDGDIFEHDFNDVVLMQFTEKLDSLGNLIFEGDILENKDKDLGEVIFENGTFKLQAITEIGTYFMTNERVIGNIYENPELSEVD